VLVKGVDVAADTGTPILAADRGTITFAGWSGG
jgi:murein DD-endopeptidase MepM/ murein hydrolase activator NlpD